MTEFDHNKNLSKMNAPLKTMALSVSFSCFLSGAHFIFMLPDVVDKNDYPVWPTLVLLLISSLFTFSRYYSVIETKFNPLIFIPAFPSVFHFLYYDIIISSLPVWVDIILAVLHLVLTLYVFMMYGWNFFNAYFTTDEKRVDYAMDFVLKWEYVGQANVNNKNKQEFKNLRY